MEALQGKPFFKEMLKAWVGSVHAGGSEDTSHEKAERLQEAVRTCALVVATLHGSNIQLGGQNTLEMQVAKLREEAEVLSQVMGELGDLIKSWIDQTVEFAQAYPAMPLCFSHGDFTYSQLILDGTAAGLVDFDTMCQAEPAQDVGQYLAYQRLNLIKDQDPNSPLPPEAVERLCALFLDTYIETSRTRIPHEGIFRGRVAIYELIGLIRLALHSWEKLKGSRLKQTLSLLEERMEWQKQIRLLAKNKIP
jgi:aminoglycoside phosphotransferase (APT) family kinase protein